MAYVDPDYKTKKKFRLAVEAGVEHRTYNPSGMFQAVENGTDTVEGPHYPRPHRWYAAVTVADGIVTKVR
jgi:hypothetical protein